MIEKALEAAGYTEEPTAEALTQCFLDFVDSGIWGDLELEEVREEITNGNITVNMMCRALIYS